MANGNNFVAELSSDERMLAEMRMNTVSPNDGKYYQKDLENYITQWAEWMACAKVQLELLRTRVEFGLADEKDLKVVEESYKHLSPLNMSLIERNETKHDQLAVLKEFNVRIQELLDDKVLSVDTEETSTETAERIEALLHPGTTSYDILDTARSYLLKQVWTDKLRPAIIDVIEWFIDLAEKYSQDEHAVLQVWRTHIQHTAPVPFALTFARTAARLAEWLENCDMCFSKMKWKVSGIVGTQSSVSMVVWAENAIQFEIKALHKLWLRPDYTATQIVSKEPLANLWNSLVTLMSTVADFAGDMRLLYSSDMAEVTSLDAKARLGWSSADASKNNPINWENIEWKFAVVEGGMRTLYQLTQTDLQRDLRGSVQARYEPQGMISEIYESLKRISRELKQLHVNRDNVEANLNNVRLKPAEPLVAILRGSPEWKHSEYWVGHNFVKEITKKWKKWDKEFREVLFADEEFVALYDSLPDNKQRIILWEIEHYQGTSEIRVDINLHRAREVITESLME